MIINLFKKVNIIILTFVLILSNVGIVFADDNGDLWEKYDGELLAKSSFVLEANSGVVLHEYNADEKMYPASLTKIMTAMVVFDKVENLEEELVFSYNAVTKDIDKNSTTIGASAGDKLSIKDCLYCILLPSANDAANALAEYVAGNINDFVLLMNEKAKMLGMNNTNFVNPTGLHNENQYTTARDMGILMSYAVKNITFIQMSGSRSYKHAPIRKYRDPDNSNNTVLNTNQMLSTGSKNAYYPGTLAGKTGYTKESGYNLAAYVKKNDLYMIVVDLNCKKINDRFTDAKNLLNFYSSKYKSYSIKDNDERFDNKYSNITVDGVVLVNTIGISVDDESCVVVPASVSFNEIDSVISFERGNSSNSIGQISYMLNNKNVGTFDLLGKLDSGEETIWTTYLNFSQSRDENEIIQKENRNENYINADAPVYRDERGKLVISKSILTALQIFFIIVIIILIVIFIKSQFIFNFFEDLKLKRMKNKRNRRWK